MLEEASVIILDDSLDASFTELIASGLRLPGDFFLLVACLFSIAYYKYLNSKLITF